MPNFFKVGHVDWHVGHDFLKKCDFSGVKLNMSIIFVKLGNFCGNTIHFVHLVGNVAAEVLQFCKVSPFFWAVLSVLYIYDLGGLGVWVLWVLWV